MPKYKHKYGYYYSNSAKRKAKKKHKNDEPNYKAPHVIWFPIKNGLVEQTAISTIYRKYNGFRFKILITENTLYAFRSIFIYREYTESHNLSGILYDPKLHDSIQSAYDNAYNRDTAKEWQDAIREYNKRKESSK